MKRVEIKAEMQADNLPYIVNTVFRHSHAGHCFWQMGEKERISTTIGLITELIDYFQWHF